MRNLKMIAFACAGLLGSMLPQAKADDWNQMVVSAHGRRIVVHLNGEKTADLANDAGRSSGRLALQINPKQDLEVWFKDIEILKLDGAR